MKVLCLASDAYGGHGGIAQACRDILEAMAKLDEVESVDVLTRNGPARASNLPFKVRQSAPKAGKLEFCTEAALLAARRGTDLVFCTHLYISPLARMIAAATSARLIIHLHGIEIWRPPTPLQRRALEAADALWCVSRDTRARTLGHTNANPERAIVLNNSVRATFSPRDVSQSRAAFKLGDEFVLLTLGRLDSRERYKGHDRVIRALPNLKTIGRHVLYMIAGEGQDQARLANLAHELGVADQVRFLGPVANEMLPSLYSASDLFVLPSTGEGFGIAFLEAMACGTPALGIDAGGAADALGDGKLGACVPEKDFDAALANAVTKPSPERWLLSAEVGRRFGNERLAADVAGALRHFQ